VGGQCVAVPSGRSAAQLA